MFPGARRDMQEVLTIKANIDCLLGYSEPGEADRFGASPNKRRLWSVGTNALLVI